MAYMSQAKKQALAPKIKEICKKHGVKATLSVHHHLELVLTVKSGKIDFQKDCVGGRSEFNYQVNPYWFHEHFQGKSKKFLTEVIEAMNDGNYDDSDPMTDYFSCGWYISINIGRWDKPYELAK